MVNRNLLRQYDLPEGQWQQELEDSFPEEGGDWLPDGGAELSGQQGGDRPASARSPPTRSGWTSATRARAPSSCASGTTKALGQIVPPQPGDEIEVLLEAVEDEDRRRRPELPQGEAAEGVGRRSSPSTRKATSSAAWSPARSRAACWSTSASTSSCRPSQVDIRRPPDIGDVHRQAPSSARSSSSTRPAATSSSAAASCSKTSATS